MAITPGTNLLHYRLAEKIGEGGMGVVWRATDTTLDREVAVKILPELLLQNPERLERFEREARVLASLHHPNIAVVHGLHEAEGIRFLVMELVDGEDLAKRLARGALAVDEALKICAQVARALQAAHDRGIVHRDLKPANIVLTTGGEAKVLDFGLAKVLEPDDGSISGETSAPTVTTGGTVAGVIMGTAAYMSPEQARGKATDRRTDVWSFGCVLHECLTGAAEFRGDTLSDSIGAILHKTPDWSALPEGVPTTVRLLLRRCLTKDRDNRLHDIADARIEVEQAIVDPEGAALGLSAGPAAGDRRGSSTLGRVAVAMLVVAAAIVAWVAKPRPQIESPLVKLAIDLPRPVDYTRFDLSPDGLAVVYTATDQEGRPDEKDEDEGPSRLWIRRLDSFLPTAIPGTEGARRPSFSPDGRTIAYTVNEEAGHRGELRVVGLDGRPPLTIAADALDHSQPRWMSNQEIVYVHYDERRRLEVISRGGGDSRVLADLPDEVNFSGWEYVILDHGRWLATTVFTQGTPTIWLIDLENLTETELIANGAGPAFLADGTVLFLRSSAVLVGKVDLTRKTPTMAGDVTTLMGSPQGDKRIAQLRACPEGHLAFITGEGPNESSRLMTLDRGGTMAPLVEEPGPYDRPQGFSPDGQTLALTMESEDGPDHLWLMELDTGRRRPVGTDRDISNGGVWLKDGRLAFARVARNERAIMVSEMRRNAVPERLFDDWPEELELSSPRLTVDGSNILFVATKDDSSEDIWIRPVDGSAPARPLISGPAEEDRPQVSPDGRWLLFRSDESGRHEIYVRRHLGLDDTESRPVRVSRSGGRNAFWSHDGTEIFFISYDFETLLSATLEEADGLPRVSDPREVAEIESLRVDPYGLVAPFLAMPDGERLLFVQPPERETKIERIEIVLNWEKQLER